MEEESDEEDFFARKDTKEDLIDDREEKPKKRSKTDSTGYLSNEDVDKYMSERNYLPAIKNYQYDDNQSDGSYHYTVPEDH
jgi:hypothetical protein